MRAAVITVETDPDHGVVGRVFLGHDRLLWLCDSYDPRLGYWLTQVDERHQIVTPGRRKNVSERAIGRTFQLTR